MPLPTLQDLLDQHAEARRDGDGWKICCPAHEDKNPSLGITERDGMLLLHCHAGCPQDEVMRAVMRTPRSEYAEASFARLALAREAEKARSFLKKRRHAE